MTVPILFVPGVLGTTLVDAGRPGRQLWGSVAGLLASRRLPVDTNGHQGLEPGEVLWRFTVVPHVYAIPVYETLARRLEQSGYQRAPLDAPTRHNGLYGLAYDWRQDIVSAARAIGIAIERLTGALGIPRVHIVAHSWGCNAVRYYLRYGGADVVRPVPEPAQPGAGRVATFFALGPLYGGTWRALDEAQHGFDVALGLGVTPQQTSTAASMYQLLPYSTGHALHEDGTSLEVDVADIDTWKSRRWGAFQPSTLARLDAEQIEHRVRDCLSRAKRASTLLETPDPADRQVRTVTYTVTDQPTLSRLVVDRDGQPLASIEMVERWAPRLLPLVSAMGDEYVTFDQIRRHAEGSELVGVEGCSHRDLYKHEAVLANLVQSTGAAA